MATSTPRLPRLRQRTLLGEGARESLLPAFKPIGIPSVAAAAAQVRAETPETSRKVERDLPPVLRHDWAA